MIDEKVAKNIKESSINNNHNVTDSDSKCGNYSYFN